MNLHEHVNPSFTSRGAPPLRCHFISAITSPLSDIYAAFNIYKRIRVRGVKISETERTRHPYAHQITLYRILHYAIFALLFLYFYIAFISRDIAIRCYRRFFFPRRLICGQLFRNKARLFNIRFSRSSDLFKSMYIAYFPRLNCNFCMTHQYRPDKMIKIQN